MKFPYAILMAASLAFFACDSGSSSTSAEDNDGGKTPSKQETNKKDCSVDDGVVVVYPAGGETFKMGDTLTVIYGASANLAGPMFRFVYRENADDMGTDFMTRSAGEANPDGKTCYEQKVVLDPELINTSDEAVIAVIPYNKPAKMGKSASFKVIK